MSWSAIAFVVWFVGMFPSAYVMARLTGDMSTGGFAPIWPIFLPLALMVRLAELGEENSK